MAQNIGQAYVQIVASADGISGDIEKALNNETKDTGKTAGTNIAKGIGGALAGGTAAIAAGVTAVGASIAKGASDFGAYGDNIDKASQKMGISAQAYQEWDAVMQHSGTSMSAMQTSMKSLVKAADSGSDAFEQLGISQEQIATMSKEDLFGAVITGLQGMDEGIERSALAQDLLGRGAVEMGALLNTSAEDTQAMRDRVSELGGVLSDDAVKSAAAFQDNMQDLQTAISGVGRGLVADFMPGINQMLTGFTMLITGEEGANEAISAGMGSLGEAVQGAATNLVGMLQQILPGLIQTLAASLPDMIALVTTLLTTLVETIVTVLPTLLTTVVPALATAAVDLVTGLGAALVEAGPALMDAGMELINMLVEALSGDGMSQMLTQGTEMLSSMANGLLEGLPQIIEIAGEIITNLLDALLTALPQLLDSGVQLLTSLLDGIIQNLPQIVTTIAEVIAQILATIVEHLPEILQQGIELLGQLAEGIIQAIPDLVAMLPQIFDGIKGAFEGFDFPSIGKNILLGIKDGILGAVDTVVGAAKEAGGAILNGLKGLFGIDSPSKLMRDEVGQWLPAGIAEGITEGMPGVIRQLNGAMDALSLQATVASRSTVQSAQAATQGQSEAQPVEVVVNMVGDTAKFFKAQVEYNRQRTRATGYNAYALR